MSRIEDIIRGVSDQLEASVVDTLGDEWESIPDAHKGEVATVLMDASALVLRSMAGEDVEAELLHARAAIASWTFVGAAKVRDAVSAAFAEAAAFVGKVFVKMVV